MEMPYGLWSSPVGLETFSSNQVTFQDLRAFEKGVCWTESRPSEGGRHALMQSSKGQNPEDLFSFMSIRTFVHEYGGGSFCSENKHLVFFDATTSSLYIENERKELVCLVQDPAKRFADFCLSSDGRKLLCVCEDHSVSDRVDNYLVQIDCTTKEIVVLDRGDDFYASPRWSPSGEKSAFLSWNAPAMPWQECKLSIRRVDGTTACFGGDGESIAQFIWTGEEEIIYASDPTGFWNLYRWTPAGTFPFYLKNADFAGPLWTLGKKNFAPCVRKGKRALLCAFCQNGTDRIGVISSDEKELFVFDLPYTVIRTLDADGGRTGYFIGGSASEPLSVIALDIDSGKYSVLARSVASDDSLRSMISFPQEISTVSSLDGKIIHGFYYPPYNPLFTARKGDLPPLLIKCHGGPTAHVSPLLNWEVQFWTSRGFGWLDVNYRGSTGYGREYREALEGKWGETDVRDCLDAALYLVKEGRVNPEGLFALGSSSGGLTALGMAASGHLKGCSVRYGVTDLIACVCDTHKFERHYLESLIGSYEREPEKYSTRSPLSYADTITCPVLFSHGDRDRVVPLDQARRMQAKLTDSQLLVFEGEGHGFKQASTLRACVQAELEFCLKRLELSMNLEL